MNRPLVSVIIPFYNREKLLARAIESVLAQTYPYWEIVLVDDGSADDSAAIAQTFCRSLPKKIRLIQQHNKGEGEARNLGIKNALGEFIALLDSDDAWRPNLLDSITDVFFYSDEVDWIYYDAQRVDSYGKVIIPSVFDDKSGTDFRKLKCKIIKKLHLIEDPYLLYVAITSTIKVGANSIVRRKVFESVAYNPNMRVGVDRLLVIEAISRGVRLGYVNEVLLDVYMHGENISINSQNNQEFKKDFLIYKDLIKVYEYVEKSIVLTRREQKGLKRRLSNLNYWLGYLMVISHKNPTLGFYYMRKGMRMWLLNPYFWKSYIASTIRMGMSIIRQRSL